MEKRVDKKCGVTVDELCDNDGALPSTSAREYKKELANGASVPHVAYYFSSSSFFFVYFLPRLYRDWRGQLFLTRRLDRHVLE